ncbi:MAG: DNA mismatch repair protein MutS, partial [Alphaproteobacteria bacterium]|nr:DNA mismatch repair protein MutS [Alphaproteobacteria bacterium]
MAGKSTFLRQNAIIAIMAQIGSFVPAASAHIGAITKLFSRVGASDNLAQGLSTFMVEMKETAAILNQADERSFVILDEIGRGTATFDGLAIAYAVLEHIDKAICCRTLFATHYHELTDVAGEFAHVAPYTVEVKEHGGDIIFMHKITKGAGQSSYGIHVAKIAGVPARVVGRAKEILGKLESTGSLVPRDLFSCPVKMPVQIEEPEAITRLKSLDLDALSPRDALERLYELKKLA